MYSDKDRQLDFEFFVENYMNIFNKYGHKFVAIKNKKIIGVYDNEIVAINEISKIYPLGTFIIQECNGRESAYTNYIYSLGLVCV